MLSPTFELFEYICTELKGRAECYITNEDFGLDAEEKTGAHIGDVLDNLKTEHDALDIKTALQRALQKLQLHFEARNSELPFTYDLNTRRFAARDHDFITFIADVSARRSSGKAYAKTFETETGKRLARKLTGIIHNVGFPRHKQKSEAQFRKYLKQLGFEDRVVIKAEKDAGLDLLWFPPLGSHPTAPVFSLQCKNGLFKRKVGNEASSRTASTLLCHSMLRGNGVHLSAIVFNDYIEPERLDDKPLTYVPLGLSDLALVKETKLIEI